MNTHTINTNQPDQIIKILGNRLMEQTIDSTICPFCGEKNNCMAGTGKSCWCNEVKVPAELLELVPEKYQRKACVCLNCIRAFEKDTLTFKKKYQQIK